MPKISEEEFNAAQKVVKEAGDEIKKEEEKKKPAEPLVQSFPFDPTYENKREIEKLKKENEDLKEVTEELKGPLLKRIEKIEQELEDLKKTTKDKRGTRLDK